MGIKMPKSGNLEKLVDGVSLLDERDRERIIRVVDALECADTKVRTEIMPDKKRARRNLRK